MTVSELFKQYAEYHAIDTKRSSHETAMKRLRLWVIPILQTSGSTSLRKGLSGLENQDKQRALVILNGIGTESKRQYHSRAKLGQTKIRPHNNAV